jgi:hypothetical protein
MRTLVVFIVIIHLFACAAKSPSDVPQTGPDTTPGAVQQQERAASDPPKPVKSPHGYIITKDYELGRFGGFVGDCTEDRNWPYYWQCMSENSGNGGFK